jgi:hypothetical protein
LRAICSTTPRQDGQQLGPPGLVRSGVGEAAMNKHRLLDNLHLKPGMQPDLTGDELVYGVLFVVAAILLASLCEIVPPS